MWFSNLPLLFYFISIVLSLHDLVVVKMDMHQWHWLACEVFRSRVNWPSQVSQLLSWNHWKPWIRAFYRGCFLCFFLLITHLRDMFDLDFLVGYTWASFRKLQLHVRFLCWLQVKSLMVLKDQFHQLICLSLYSEPDFIKNIGGSDEIPNNVPNHFVLSCKVITKG